MTAMEIVGLAAGIVSCLTFWKEVDGIELFQLSSRLARDMAHEL